MAAQTPLISLPQNNAEWTREATRAGVVNRSLRSCHDLQPGSNISLEQFLLCRVVCPPIIGPHALNLGHFGLAQYVPQAAAVLASPEFTTFVAALAAGQPPAGMFASFLVPLPPAKPGRPSPTRVRKPASSSSWMKLWSIPPRLASYKRLPTLSQLLTTSGWPGGSTSAQISAMCKGSPEHIPQ